MKEERLEKLLSELADATAEPVHPDLAEDIKHRIPRRLMHHRGGVDTINIMIDLRINKLAAAAAIIITMILCATFLGGRDSTSEGIIQDSRLLVKYFLGGESAGRSDVLAVKSRYEYLVQKGKDAVYYGDSIAGDSDAVWMQWKLANGKYRLIFGDLREAEVSADELIKLQARMLQKKTK